MPIRLAMAISVSILASAARDPVFVVSGSVATPSTIARFAPARLAVGTGGDPLTDCRTSRAEPSTSIEKTYVMQPLDQKKMSPKEYLSSSTLSCVFFLRVSSSLSC